MEILVLSSVLRSQEIFNISMLSLKNIINTGETIKTSPAIAVKYESKFSAFKVADFQTIAEVYRIGFISKYQFILISQN